MTRTQTVGLIYYFGPFRLDAHERLLSCGGAHVPLPPKVLETLLALVADHGRVIEKGELMQRVWPDTFVEEVNLAKNISALRKVLNEGDRTQEFIETIPKRGYRFVASVRQLLPTEPAPETSRVVCVATEPLGGAVPLDSPFYLIRSVDYEFSAAVERCEGILRLEGARQVGKTSLLARGVQQARNRGWRVLFTDLQTFTSDDLVSMNTFLLALSEQVADRLELELSPRLMWESWRSPTLNFEKFLRRHVLCPQDQPLLWAVDEVDRLFSRPFAFEVLALFRSWHNARSLEPEGPWQRLTLAISYSTEAHLFLTSLYQSPFNVGTRLFLEELTLEEVQELNQRYGSPLGNSSELGSYLRLVGGNPYLVNCGLHELAHCGLSLDGLKACADSDQGPFADYLHRILVSLHQEKTLLESVRQILANGACPDADMRYRLRCAGIVMSSANGQCGLSCQLLADYLKKHLT
jgi:DNA-binding winged helix-turn-helix (wHTH) protein